MDAKQTFDGAAASYDALRRQLIPCFDGFYGAAAELASSAVPTGASPRILDLGAGTGLLADELLRRLPAAHITLRDFSGPMLAQARARFASRPDAVAYQLGDYASDDLGGPWDAIVSALSIHHLQDPEKRRLYARAFAALAPGGIFVNADNVTAEDRAVQARDRAAWVAAIRANGVGEAELAAALERTKVDVLAPLGVQLAWLREAGFAEVDCVYKWRQFAVFSGRRPG